MVSDWFVADLCDFCDQVLIIYQVSKFHNTLLLCNPTSILGPGRPQITIPRPRIAQRLLLLPQLPNGKLQMRQWATILESTPKYRVLNHSN
jgi:hypothetical protein